MSYNNPLILETVIKATKEDIPIKKNFKV